MFVKTSDASRREIAEPHLNQSDVIAERRGDWNISTGFNLWIALAEPVTGRAFARPGGPQ
jgi:hypothetical protein